MGILVMVGQLILSLSILIVLHELGHFTPAKLFGTRVDKFYLFFDPYFSLFKFQKGETEYGIGWLPLGGYVKIAGMVDESFDTEMLKEEPKPWEFRSKPAWQRLIIMLGGVTVNFFLGFLIFIGISAYFGESYLPNDRVAYGIAVDSLGTSIGLRAGDQIVAVGDQPMEKFNPGLLRQEAIFNDARSITVRRDARELTLPLSDDFVKELGKYSNQKLNVFSIRLPFVAASIAEDSPADEAGIEVEDKLLAVNGTPTPYHDVFVDVVKPYAGEQIALTIERDGQTMTKDLTVSDAGIIGVYAAGPDYFFDFETEKFTLAESIPKGIDNGWEFLSLQGTAFKKMFSGDVDPNESLGSFISIGKMFGERWDWRRFWNLTASLSLILAFMNLLPIPGLDGGHVMFLLYEMVSGRKPSDKVLEWSTMIGFGLIVILMIYVIGLDIGRLF